MTSNSEVGESRAGKLGTGGGCPICGKPMSKENRPFCSPRCKIIDLGRWLDGDYRLPSEDEPDEAEIIDLASHLPTEE